MADHEEMKTKLQDKGSELKAKGKIVRAKAEEKLEKVQHRADMHRDTPKE